MRPSKNYSQSGQRRDYAISLQKHGDRWYDPWTGRCLSEDPLSFDAGDANLYRFVGNSRTNFTDPTGTTLSGNPLTNVIPNTSAGGYTGNKLFEDKPYCQYVANGSSGLSAGTFETVLGNAAYSAATSYLGPANSGRSLTPPTVPKKSQRDHCFCVSQFPAAVRAALPPINNASMQAKGIPSCKALKVPPPDATVGRFDLGHRYCSRHAG